MDGAAWEDHGANPCNPRTFDEGDERVANQSVDSNTQCFFLIDRASEKFAKRLIGRADVEAAFLSIDILTKDETIMAVAKTLEVVFDIKDNIKGIWADVGSANAHVQAMGRNLEAMNKGTQGVLSHPVHILTISPPLSHNRYE